MGSRTWPRTPNPWQHAAATPRGTGNKRRPITWPRAWPWAPKTPGNTRRRLRAATTVAHLI
eukprot:10358434-Lingulodinium_polyedra.AAC.1